MPGLSCSVACGILVPRPGIELMSSALAGGFLTTGPLGKPSELGIIMTQYLSRSCWSLLNNERKPPESRSIWLEFTESVLFSWGPEGFFVLFCFKETNDTDFPLMVVTNFF